MYLSPKCIASWAVCLDLCTIFQSPRGHYVLYATRLLKIDQYRTNWKLNRVMADVSAPLPLGASPPSSPLPAFTPSPAATAQAVPPSRQATPPPPAPSPPGSSLSPLARPFKPVGRSRSARWCEDGSSSVGSDVHSRGIPSSYRDALLSSSGSSPSKSASRSAAVLASTGMQQSPIRPPPPPRRLNSMIVSPVRSEVHHGRSACGPDAEDW